MDNLPALVRRYIVGAWRHRWVALALAWVICVGGWIGVAMIPNQYESSARLYVDADAVLTPLLRGIAVDTSPVNQLDIVQRTLLSRPNLDKLISRTDLELTVSTQAQREQLISQLGQAIRIQPQGGNLFLIEYMSKDPHLAYQVVQAIITMFMEAATGNNRAQIDNARQFLQQQISDYEGKLHAAEQRRADFQAKYVDILPGANGSASRLEGARNQVRSLQDQLDDAVARRELLAKELESTPPLISTDTQYVGGVSPALADAQRRLAELQLRDTDQHPDVIAAKKLVAMLKAHGGTASQAPSAIAGHSLPNPLFEQLKVRLVDADAQVASLQRGVREASAERDRLETMARNEPGLMAEFMSIDRDYNVLRENYEQLLARRESMRIGAAADTDADKMKLQVIDPPQVPRAPVGPKRKLFTAGVLVAGIGAGTALALLLFQLDTGFHTVADLRILGLPVLGGIALLHPPSRRKHAAALFSFGTGLALLVVAFGAVLGGSLSAVLSRFV